MKKLIYFIIVSCLVSCQQKEFDLANPIFDSSDLSKESEVVQNDTNSSWLNKWEIINLRENSLIQKKTRSAEELKTTLSWTINVVKDGITLTSNEIKSIVESAFMGVFPEINGIRMSSVSCISGRIELVLSFPYKFFVCCDLYDYSQFFIDVVSSKFREDGYNATIISLFQHIHDFSPLGGTIGIRNPDTGGTGETDGGSGSGESFDYLPDGPEAVYPNLNIPLGCPPRGEDVCLATTMLVANYAFGGSVSYEYDYILDYMRMEGTDVPFMALEKMPQFINRHFYTTSFLSFSEAMSNDYLVFVDATSSLPNYRHYLLVVGYEGDNRILVLNPDYGRLETVSISSVGLTRIVVTGVKEFNYN